MPPRIRKEVAVRRTVLTLSALGLASVLLAYGGPAGAVARPDPSVAVASPGYCP